MTSTLNTAIDVYLESDLHSHNAHIGIYLVNFKKSGMYCDKEVHFVAVFQAVVLKSINRWFRLDTLYSIETDAWKKDYRSI